MILGMYHSSTFSFRKLWHIFLLFAQVSELNTHISEATYTKTSHISFRFISPLFVCNVADVFAIFKYLRDGEKHNFCGYNIIFDNSLFAA